MKILGIESASDVASVALIDDDKLTAEYTVNYKKTHSQTLLPMIDEIVRMTETDLAQVDAIAISAGPGSYTGLRIGAATAKGLALALDKPMVAVPTLDAMAYNLLHVSGIVCPMMDARRGQLYNGLYHTDDELEGIAQSRIIMKDELMKELDKYGEHVYLLGDGVKTCKDEIEHDLHVPYTIVGASMNAQRAASVAMLGRIYYERGDIVQSDNWGPEYLIKTQAEREREAKGLPTGQE